MSSVSQWGYALVSHCANLTSAVTAELFQVILVPMASVAASAGDVTPTMRP